MPTGYEQAREKLAELIENAHKGAIIPVRLPSQLEEIAALLDETGEGAPAEEAAAGREPEDVETLMRANAEFVSTAVHELRTPMTSIRGYSDMLNTPAMGELNDMQKQFLDTIRSNARRMEGLLQDVSDISKIRAGVLKLSEKMDMFKNIAMTVEKETAPLAEEYNRSLTFDIPQGLPLLNTDGEYFAKALIKLIENALQYTEDDGEVLVKAAADDGMLVVQVTDNGIGMTEEEIAHLGELYWRADNDRVLAHKGSGLGIPVAYGIIDLLGGRISVESTPGEGTTFTIRLAGMT